MSIAVEVFQGLELERRVSRRRRPVRVAPALPPARFNEAPLWDMHPGAYGVWLGCWGVLLAIFAATFAGFAYPMYMLAIVACCALAFFSLPVLMARQSARSGWNSPTRQSFGEFLDSPFQTATGAMAGREALIQMVLVPVALSIGAAMIGIIIAAAR
jgi:hypothetical protein